MDELEQVAETDKPTTEENINQEPIPTSTAMVTSDPDNEDEPDNPHTCHHCMVRMRYAGRCSEYCSGPLDLNVGNSVVIDCERGVTMGKVLTCKPCDNCHNDCQLPKVTRLATDSDQKVYERNQEREKEAFAFCQQRIIERSLPMKLLGVELMLNGNKAIFYFFSEGRVDFRSLVKDLAQKFHTRIEMRQIGVRDGAKILGGLGICGRELCCAGWLTTFEPVSIRMAKEQNLSLNPQKVSGLCGRLMCCLVYEQATYTLLRKGLPKIGKKVTTPLGEGRVREVNVILRQAKVEIGTETMVFCIDDDGNYLPVVANTETSKVLPLDCRENRQEALLSSPIEPSQLDDDTTTSDDNQNNDALDLDEDDEANPAAENKRVIEKPAENNNPPPNNNSGNTGNNTQPRHQDSRHRQERFNNRHDRPNRNNQPPGEEQSNDNNRASSNNYGPRHNNNNNGSAPHPINRRHHRRPGNASNNYHGRPQKDPQ